MKIKMNDPVWSKINWTASAVLAIGVANTLGVIPPEWQAHAIDAATIVLPVLIVLWRTKFTEPTT